VGGGLLPRGKATGAWSWPLTYILFRGQECVGPNLRSWIRLHSVVLS